MISRNISVSTVVADFRKKRLESIIPELTETEIKNNEMKNKNKNNFYTNIKNKKKIKNKYVDKDWKIESKNRINAVEKATLKSVQWEVNDYENEEIDIENSPVSYSNSNSNLYSKSSNDENEIEFCGIKKNCKNNLNVNENKNVKSKNIPRESVGARAVLHSLLSNHPLHYYG